MQQVSVCFNKVKNDCLRFIKSQETSTEKFQGKEKMLKSFLIPMCFWIANSIRNKKPYFVGLAGGQGTGKTTISRKLIQNFASEDDVKFDFYPVLDPKFESELVLLQHLVDLFGIEEEAGASVIDCRNQIEHHLINAGVEEGRVLVLVIDEGQNLKGEFLDVFRTLLNFETVDFKLL